MENRDAYLKYIYMYQHAWKQSGIREVKWQDGRSEYLPGGAGRNMLIIYKMTYMEDRGKVFKVAERAE